MKKVKTWWFLLIAGLMLIAVGVLAFIDPLGAYIKLVRYSGPLLTKITPVQNSGHPAGATFCLSLFY